jgi:hypothetical protein
MPSQEVAAKPKLGVRSRPLTDHSKDTGQIQSETSVHTLTPTDLTPEFSIDPDNNPIDAPNTHNSHVPLRETMLQHVGTVILEPQTHQEEFKTSANQKAQDPIDTPASAFSEVVHSTQAQKSPTTNVVPVVFNRSLPFPSLPTQPNILIGMVYDAAGSILPNAILEIINEQGNTARALRTNLLGQFYTSTPLPAGNYIIEVELDGHVFPKFSLQTQNTVLDPIEIRSTART